MKKKSTKLVIVSFIFGVLFGTGIVALKGYIRGQLTAMLDDMVQRSCPCSFEVEKVSISLLTLSAKAENARIVSGGDTKLIFKTIRAHFGLSRLREHIIPLSLELTKGRAFGVGPESATFKFIDFLTEPLPPEKDYPGRWKVKLQKLEMQRSSLVERFTSSELRASKIRLNVSRDDNNDFVLLPVIKSLKVRLNGQNGSSGKEIFIGRLGSRLLLKEGRAEFQSLKLIRGNSWLRAEALSDLRHNNKLTGSIKYHFDSSSYNFPPWITTILDGTGTLGGSLGNPSFVSEIKEHPGELSIIRVAGEKLLELDSIRGSFSFDLNHRKYIVRLNSLRGSGSGAEVKIDSESTVIEDRLSIAADIHTASTNFKGITFKNSDTKLKISGDLSTPILKTSSDIKTVQIAERLLGPARLDLKLKENLLDVTATERSGEFGYMSANGALKISDKGPGEIKSLDFEFKDLVLLSAEKALPSESVRVNGRGILSGPLTLDALEGKATLVLSSQHFAGEAALKGNVSLSKGEIAGKVFNDSKSLEASLTCSASDPQNNLFKVELNSFKPDEYDPDLECIKLSAALSYHFSLDSPGKGDGLLSLKEAEFGCSPYTTVLNEPQVLEIRNGELKLKRLSFLGPETKIDIEGSLSPDEGYDLKGKGSVQLHSLLGLIKGVDDISGLAAASVSLSGPLTAPVATGEATITNGEISVEAADISAREINGSIKADLEKIEITGVSGILNEGWFTLNGTLYPLHFADSELKLDAEGVEIYPAENVHAVLSGKLLLSRGDSGSPLLAGTVGIDQGEFEKQLDFKAVLRALTEMIFSTSKTPVLLSRIPKNTLGKIELDIKVEAPRNLFLITNWASAELGADFKISGILAEPKAAGVMTTLDGWFGLKDKLFSISSGKISVQPQFREPKLDILAETNVRTPIGDSMLVFLEATGPISSPRVKLSSDQGYSERELLAMLTSASTFSGSVPASSFGLRLTNEGGGYLGRKSLMSKLVGTFEEIANIDSLSIEPAYNLETGTINPKAVASKNLTEALELRAESLFDASNAESSLSLRYKLTPKLDLTGRLRDESSQENTALGVDVGYTILSRQSVFLKIKLEGNRHINRNRLLKQLRLSENSRLKAADLPSVKNQLLSAYRDLGYFKVQASVDCKTSGGYCRKLLINISEGPKHTIARVVFEGDEIESILGDNLKKLPGSNIPASKTLLEESSAFLVKRLRSEGYISAKVTGKYEPLGKEHKELLIFDVKTGKPVSFYFTGNKAFSARDFLNTVNLFSRRQPFGSNTINILIENIEQLYRRSGYLFAAIKHTEEREPDSGRILYHITIDEGDIIPVSKVLVHGGSLFSFEKLKNLLEENNYDSETIKEICNPKYAVEEDLRYYSGIIKSLVQREGFPDASVYYEISPDSAGKAVQISYIIEPGQGLLADKIEIVSFPDDITMPTPPRGPYSIPNANRYIDSLISLLIESGYFSPNIFSNMDTENSVLSITVDAGVQAKIGSISVEGNSNTESDVIIKRLYFHSGSPWNAAVIEKSKKHLLRSGLFSRVQIFPADGEIDSEAEDVVVRVYERRLRTLELGGGVDSENGLHVFGEETDRKFFGDGRLVSLRLDGYYDPTTREVTKGVAGARYSDPYLFTAPYRLTEELRYQRTDNANQEFDTNRVSLASYLDREWENGIQIALGHTALFEDLNNVEPDAVIGEFDSGAVRLSFLSGRAILDRRDNVLNPNKGYSISLNYKTALKVLGSDADFISLGGGFTFLQPLPFSSRLSLAFRSNAGVSETFGNTDEVPITQRFYLGGQSTIRGFRENSLGPRGAEGSVIGGDLFFADNAELRFRLTESIGIHLFMDAGGVYLKERSVSLDDFRESAGIGIRYLSPVGPIGFDLGHPLDERAGEPSVRLHFNIGSKF